MARNMELPRDAAAYGERIGRGDLRGRRRPDKTKCLLSIGYSEADVTEINAILDDGKLPPQVLEYLRRIVIGWLSRESEQPRSRE